MRTMIQSDRRTRANLLIAQTQAARKMRNTKSHTLPGDEAWQIAANIAKLPDLLARKF